MAPEAPPDAASRTCRPDSHKPSVSTAHEPPGPGVLSSWPERPEPCIPGRYCLAVRGTRMADGARSPEVGMGFPHRRLYRAVSAETELHRRTGEMLTVDGGHQLLWLCGHKADSPECREASPREGHFRRRP